jgi:transketolase C-terminal domain/subunit
MAEEVSPRETYGKTLVELGEENPDIVVLDADLSHSTMTGYCRRAGGFGQDTLCQHLCRFCRRALL